jgi:hypothetical protein
LGEHHHNAHDLTEYLRRDERRLLGIESERAGRRFHWSWTESGSAGFSITHEQSVWAVMHVGTRFVSKGWVTCRRVETINPRLSQPDVDFFWGCIRSLPVGDVELPHWG